MWSARVALAGLVAALVAGPAAAQSPAPTATAGPVSPLGSNITLTLSYAQPTYNGTIINADALLTDNLGNPLANQPVTFSTVGQPNAGSRTVTTDTNGMANAYVTYNLAGVYQIQAAFPGNTVYQPVANSTAVTVYWQTQIPAVANPEPVAPGQTTVITPTLTAITNQGVLPITGATVTIAFGDGQTGQYTTDQNGQVQAPHVYQAANTYVVTARYAGTNGTGTSSSPPLYGSSSLTNVRVINNGTSGALNLNVAPPTGNYYQTGVPISVTSCLTSGTTIAGVTISFTTSTGQTASATTGANGCATTSFTLPAGSQGNVTFSAQTVGVTPTATATPVTKTVYGPTTTTLTVTPNPGAVGQTITYVATVLPLTTQPNGVGSTVTFTFGDNTSQVVVLNGTTATVTHTYGASGTYTVTAVTADNLPNYLLGSQAAGVSLVIGGGGPTPPPPGPGSNVTVTVSANPGQIVHPDCASLEHPITFTSTLCTPSTYTGPAPSGYVTYIIIQQSTAQALNLGTVPVNAPTQAYQTCAYAQLKAALSVPKGFYNIQATYLPAAGGGASVGTLYNFYVDKMCEKGDLLEKLKLHWHDHVGDAMKDDWHHGDDAGKVVYQPGADAGHGNVTYAPPVYDHDHDKALLG